MAGLGTGIERGYISWRLKMSSFSRWEQFEHPRQQKRRIATPTVTIVARILALDVNQWIKSCRYEEPIPTSPLRAA